MKVQTILLIFFLLASFPNLLIYSQAFPSQLLQSNDLDYSSLIQSVNMTEVKRLVEFFTSLGTRATGYEGNVKAALYIYNYFKDLGLSNVHIENFTVAEPINYGSNITLLSGPDAGRVLEIHPIRPNLVCTSTTPPGGLEGKLIYVGSGYLEDFDGVEVNGSIVIMDWYTMDRWINAAKLGAKAVIFIPPKRIITSPLGWSKRLKYLDNVPFKFPRFYVERDGATILLDNLGEDVRIVANQTWTKVQVMNVYAFLKGKDPEKADKFFVLTSYYDSYSPAPSVAPGAQEATGISALLELAKYFSSNPPDYSILFIAFGGHHQALTGSSYWATESFRPVDDPRRNETFEENYSVQINLDLQTGTDIPYFTSYLGAWSENARSYWDEGYWWELLANFFRQVVEDLNEKKPAGMPEAGYRVRAHGGLYGYAGLLTETEHIPTQPWKEFPYDHEPALLNCMPAYTITTAFDDRPVYGEPFDTLELVNFDNLKTQLEIIRVFLVRLFNMSDDEYNQYVKRLKDREKNWLSSRTYDWHMIRGVVAEWSRNVADYVPVPNSLVTFTSIGGRGIGPFIYLRRFTFTDEYGRFEFTGANQWDAIWAITAWKVDRYGNVIYAPDLGIHAWAPIVQNFGYRVGADRYCDVGFLVVFKAASLVLFDIISTSSLSLAETETGIQYPILTVYQSDVHLPPESHSYWQYGTEVTVVNVPPDVPIEVLWKFGVERFPRGVVANITEKKILGFGYKLKVGEVVHLPLTSLIYADAFCKLNDERYKLLREFVPNLEEYDAFKNHLRAKELINEARDAFSNHKYLKAYRLILEAWDLSYKSYRYSRKWFEDTSLAVPFFAALMIPFVIIVEKLTFNLRGFKKIISYLGIFSVTLTAFYVLHPGFHIAASPVMIIIGFSVLILSFPILMVLLRYASEFIRVVRITRIGMHEVGMSRLGMADRAISIGIEFMRKRSLRSVLTLISIIIMVASLTSLTSIEAYTFTKPSPGKGPATYQGIYIHKEHWGAGSYSLPVTLLEFIKSMYGDNATIAPRAWKYTPYSGIIPFQYKDSWWKGETIGFKLIYEGKRVSIPVLWGLTPEEYEIGWPKPYLIHGEWFAPGSSAVMIVTEFYAEELGLNLTEIDLGMYPSVTFEGIEFKIIGVVSNDIQEQLDLDGAAVTPIMSWWSAMTMGANPWLDDVHLDPTMPGHGYVILPYQDVMALGGNIASISMKVDDPDIVYDMAENLFHLFPDYRYYISYGGKTYTLYKGLTFTAWGLTYQIIPLLIVMLAVFNIMLGTVHERKNIIAIYSTLGLSAAHIGFMFLAEAVAYALIGGIVGYLLAILQSHIFSAFIPPINYSSTWSLVAVGGSMLITVASSLYPIILASRLVTPSLERVWRIPTKPRGDVWEIPFPFYASTIQEAKGIISFLKEYMEPHLLRDAPGFSVSNLKVSEGMMADQPYVRVSMDARLPPYELGVSQKVEVYMLQMEPKRWGCQIVLKRKTGTSSDWEKLNKSFLDLLRKQMLLWRTLRPEEKDRYMKLFKEESS